MTSPVVYQCPLCFRKHPIRFCKGFKAMNPKQRADAVLAHDMCFNCLAQEHTTGRCRSVNSCKECGLGHHTMLHDGEITRLTSTSKQRKAKKSTTERSTANKRGAIQSAGNQRTGNQRAGNQRAGNQRAGSQRVGNQRDGNQRDSNQRGNQQRASKQYTQGRAIQRSVRSDIQRSVRSDIQQLFNNFPLTQQPNNQQYSFQQPDNQQYSLQQPNNQQYSLQQQDDGQRSFVINTIIESLAKLRDIM